jgi:hypothetical protein
MPLGCRRPVTVKGVELVAVPPGVVTEIRPVAAPAGTVAPILVFELTVNAAAVPANLTDVVPVKFVPLIVTSVPTGPLIGENDEIVGFAVVTRNLVLLKAVPPGVVTAIRPVAAPAGTVAVILVSVSTVNDADVPANLTAVAPVKCVPRIVTVVPTGPLVGENDEIVGFAAVVTVNLASLVSVPPGVVTEIRPVAAPAGTVAVIFVFELTVNEADVPANLTDVAPAKPLPLIVTVVPTGPLVGENDEIVGSTNTVKSEALVAVPSAVTLMGPVVAPEGTVAVIFVSESTSNTADFPLNFTAVAPLKFVPLIVTDVPTTPPVGENEEIVGAAPHAGVGSAMITAIVAATMADRRTVSVPGPDMGPLLASGGQPKPGE